MTNELSQPWMSPTKVLLVMSGHVVRRGVVQLLEDLPRGIPEVVVVGEAEDLSGALELAASTHPHVAICRGPQAGPDPIQLVEGLAQASPSPVPVVILSRLMPSATTVQSLRCGAAACLSSDVEPIKLALALLMVRLGGLVLGNEAQQAVRAYLHGDVSEKPETDLLSGLTARERQVLELVSDGLANKEIAAQLKISRRTAEMHVGHLIAKVGARSRSDLLVRVSRILQ